MKNLTKCATLLATLVFPSSALSGGRASDPAEDKAAFEQAAARGWKEVFSDPCTGDWKRKWHLDGEVGTVTNHAEGMDLTDGPEFKNESHHVVLWTKDSFTGDVKIQYDITRLDEAAQGAIILIYIQAPDSGVGACQGYLRVEQASQSALDEHLFRQHAPLSHQLRHQSG